MVSDNIAGVYLIMLNGGYTMSITGTSPGAYACNIAIKQMIEEYGEEQINNFKGEIFISYVINNLLYGDSAK